MALAATIFKANIGIADMDRNHYQQYALTLARHPSETNERMMARLCAFMLHASDSLIFTRGLSEMSEPDLWEKNPAGDIGLWIEVGQPDAKRLLQASRRAGQVIVYAYGKNADQWWKKIEKRLEEVENFSMVVLPASVTRTLSELVERTMDVQCTIQDKQMYMVLGGQSVHIDVAEACRR